MIISINPTDERAIYVQIMDEIKRALVMGTLQPNDLLPSVRQLAGDIKENPNTVKQAYRELEHEGLIHGERGRGTFVSHTCRILPGRVRNELTRAVAERAVRDAYRHGLTSIELIEAICELPGKSVEGEGAA